MKNTIKKIVNFAVVVIFSATVLTSANAANLNFYDNNYNHTGSASSNHSGGYNFYDNNYNHQGSISPNGSGGYNLYDNNYNFQGFVK